MMTNSERRVHEVINEAVASSSKTQRRIAIDLDFDQQNMISMIKRGEAKLPINRIPGLARALGLDPYELLALAMAEYQPKNWAVIEQVTERHRAELDA